MRVHLKGQGTPIPSIALPDPSIDPNLPVTTLVFTEDTDFSVPDYESFGFTHFEAWCVGAAGGRGGDGGSEVVKVFENTRHSVPQDVWDLHIQRTRVTDYKTRQGEWDHIYAWGDGAGLMTMTQHEEYINPSHEFDFYHLTSMSLKYILGVGGPGGGGGLHKVSGALADLPDSVPIVVGKVGANAPLGQVQQDGVLTPDGYHISVTPPPGYPNPPPVPSDWSIYNGSPLDVYLNQLANWFEMYTFTNPNPGISFASPIAGENGGASSFGDVCKASGGKSGGPSARSGNSIVHGNGGAGGIGESLVSGGGGAGSITANVKGSDGTWTPATGIGQGGGGGKSSPGGRGSYSFADTTIYGPGELVGGGGGARPRSNLKVGSKASGYSPNGVVVIRLSKVE